MKKKTLTKGLRVDGGEIGIPRIYDNPRPFYVLFDVDDLI